MVRALSNFTEERMTNVNTKPLALLSLLCPESDYLLLLNQLKVAVVFHCSAIGRNNQKPYAFASVYQKRG